MDTDLDAAQVDAGSAETIVNLKEELLREFRKELTTQLETHRVAMGQEIRSLLSTSNTKIMEEIWSGAADGIKNASRILESNGRPPLRTPSKLEYAAGKERSSIPLLKWACVVTVTSFVYGVPSLRGWIPNTISNGLSGHTDTIGEASGLSMMLFSFKPQGGRSRIRCPVGRLWTFVMRRAVVTALVRARTMYFAGDEENCAEDVEAMGSSGGSVVAAPRWLIDLGNKRETSKAVNQVFEALERSNAATSVSSADSDSGSSRKRRKTGDAAEMSMDEGARAIKEIRRQWMEKLNHARTEVRSYLYLKLMFIFEKQERFRTLAAMRAAGYMLKFDDEDAPDLHSADLDLWEDTVWDIPSTKTYELQEGGRTCPESSNNAKEKARADADEWNKREFQKLQKSFPSLNAVVKYYKRVEVPPGAEERENGQCSSDGVIWWPALESVSLHALAIGVQMELFKMKTCAEVLCTSPFSLKTVHVIAIGLRGLIKKCQSTEITDIEKCAMGAVTNEEWRTGDNSVTVRMEGKRRGKGVSRLETNRKLKYEMRYEDFVQERNAKAARERMSVGSSLSNIVQTSAQAVDIEDLL